jgi:PAS domain S-box-containing protein
MLKRIRKSLTLKWTVLLTLFTVTPPVIACLSIFQIYHEDLKRSFIAVEGVVLILGILFSFFLTRKLILPVEQLSREVGETGKASWHLPVEPATEGGVEDLAQSFDHMIRVSGQSKGASKEGKEQYWRIFENSKDTVYITSVDGKIIDINQAGVEMLGYGSKEELIKLHPKDFYFSCTERKGYINEVARNGFVKNFETKLKRKDGVPIDVLMTVNVRKDASGNRVGYEGFIKDISDRKRMEEELRKSEERYRTIIESIQDAYYESDLAGNYTVVNDAVCRHLGYSKEELIGMNFRQHSDEKTRIKLKALHAELYRTGKPIDAIEAGHIRKDGTKGTVEISVSLIRDSEGKPVGFRGISRDVTERKQMEEALRENENRLQAVLDASPIGISWADMDGNIKYVNRKFVQLFGYTVEDIPTVAEWRRLAYPDPAYRETVPSLIAKLTEAQKQGREIRPMEMTIKCKDGSTRYVEQMGTFVSNRILAIYNDLTERKQAEEALRQSEEKYRTILETMQDAYYEVDLAGSYTFVNDALCRNFGYTKEELIGMKSLRHQDEAKAKKTYDSFKEIYRTGEPVKALEVEYTGKAGTKGTYELSASLIRDAQGKPIGFRGISRDITERKQMEEALRESENKFRSLVENSIVGVYLVQDGVFKYVNSRVGDIHGYKIEEMVEKMGPKQTTLPEDLSIVEGNIGKRMKGEEESIHYEFRIITKGQEIKNVEVFGSRIMYQGRPAVIGTMLDITDRKKAEEALRQSEEKYRTILENVQEAYFEDDLSGNLTFFNDVLCRHLGYTREELIGMNYRRYTEEEDARKLHELYNGVYRTGKPVTALGMEATRKDGTKLNYETSVSLIRNSEGKPIGFRGISRDITERMRAEEALRRSEERYRTIIDDMQEAYFEDDLSGNLTFFNDVLCRSLGYTREELIGMNYRQRVDEKGARKLRQFYSELYRTGKPIKALEAEFVRKDGTKLIGEFSASLIRNSEGKPIGLRGISRDITEKKKMEEQLFQAEKLRAVGEMASGVAHDFNNALAAILGNTQLLLHTAQDEELKETLKIIEKVAKDSGQTIRRLQDFTRKRVGQELFKVDVNAIIKDSMEMTKPKWKDEPQSRGIRIEVVSNLEEIPSVSGNASELREVITNMIFNAIEAMPEGGKIEIRTFKKRRDVLIQISDTGIGIAEETEKRIFEPFFTTKPFTNTGLGLSMSYGIIKRFGGDIEVESEVGRGTTLTIIMPIGGEEKEEAVSPQTIRKGRQALILVIDDDEFVRSVLSRTLAQANHQVTLAENGEKGVQIFKEGKFDIVLTDLGLPGMSGWEVCRMIKEISPQTPVGMITGWGVEKDRSEVEEYGLDFFISKPFDFNQILNVVSETMASKEE